MLVAIIGFIVVGLIVGFVARALLPGRDPMSVPMTILLGIAGAVIGGVVGHAINKDNSGPQWILSVLAAIVLLLVFRSVNGRSRRHVL
ncbi:MAG: GlsB/YeaQ/YmgE family stress response membrane protein [Actinomycetota bacterium]